MRPIERAAATFRRWRATCYGDAAGASLIYIATRIQCHVRQGRTPRHVVLPYGAVSESWAALQEEKEENSLTRHHTWLHKPWCFALKRLFLCTSLASAMTSAARKASRKKEILSSKVTQAEEKAALRRQASNSEPAASRRRTRGMAMASRGMIVGGMLAVLLAFLLQALFTPPPRDAQAAAEAAAAATAALKAKAEAPVGSDAKDWQRMKQAEKTGSKAGSGTDGGSEKAQPASTESKTAFKRFGMWSSLKAGGMWSSLKTAAAKVNVKQKQPAAKASSSPEASDS